MSAITYIIQLDGPEPFVKFGRTKNPRSRLATLSVGTPWPVRVVALIGADIEKELKREFSGDCVRGEWFRATESLKNWLDKAQEEGRLVKQTVVDQAYINAVIKPRIREYLNGREPYNGPGGDLVCRIFADMLPSLGGREKDLTAATKGHVTEAVCRGFGPTTEPHTLMLADARPVDERRAVA